MTRRSPAQQVLRRRAFPFAAVGIGVVVALPLGVPGANLVEVAVAGALTLAILVTGLSLRWSRLPSWAAVAPALAYLVVVVLLRDAAGGGPSALGVLVLLPIVWMALYASRWHLLVTLAGTALVFVVPILVVGPPDYPTTEWRRAVVTVTVAALVGATVQRLVGEVRERAGVQDTISRVARELTSGRDTREEICRAACDLSAASTAFLLEPVADQLVSTAMVGADLPEIRIAVGREPSGSVKAFISGRPLFVADVRSDEGVSQRLADALGARTALYQPVLNGRAVIGVLTVVWREPVRELSDPRAQAIGLLALEAAVAIERADRQATLARQAQTDPLTGLGNRRLWDEALTRELERAKREGVTTSVALLDLDHFKALNDERGHQAGDRFLRAAAAAWRAQIRGEDLLVRHGGEEFAVLLHDCDPEEAAMIAERVRQATPEGLTCSAGVATHEPGEDASALVERADAALYLAKRRGRDRVETAV
jgi:diguanylate cyclase (GGDEF)-like protein